MAQYGQQQQQPMYANQQQQQAYPPQQQAYAAQPQMSTQMKPDFQTGLFDCCSDCGLCCRAYCCSPCVFGETQEMIGNGSCFGQGCLFCICPICVGTMGRGKIREKFNIDGSTFNDCLLWCCCALCAMVQERREVELYMGKR